MADETNDEWTTTKERSMAVRTAIAEHRSKADEMRAAALGADYDTALRSLTKAKEHEALADGMFRALRMLFAEDR